MTNNEDKKQVYNCAPWDSNFEQNKPKFRSERAILSDGDRPFDSLAISDTQPLDSVVERSTCPRCTKSYKYFCYLCNEALPSTRDIIPQLSCRLPCKVDIIKDPREVDGKSTAIHARIVCPQDVSIYDFPNLPDLSNSSDEQLLFLYPKPNASTLEDVASEFTHLFRSGTSSTTSFKSDQLVIRPKFRLIVVDAAWKNAKKIVREVEKYNLKPVQIADRDTLFWRYQTGLSKKHLATIEAIYYFLVDFHVIVMERAYSGEYDNLLYLFKFMYQKIHCLYDKSTLRSYNRRHESLVPSPQTKDNHSKQHSDS